MVQTTPPKYASLGMPLILSYDPPNEKIAVWHTVKNGRTESLQTVAEQYSIPVDKLVEFNFPGTTTGGRLVPDIVNWYLFNHQRFRCGHTTRDGFNYVF